MAGLVSVIHLTDLRFAVSTRFGQLDLEISLRLLHWRSLWIESKIHDSGQRSTYAFSCELFKDFWHLAHNVQFSPMKKMVFPLPDLEYSMQAKVCGFGPLDAPLRKASSSGGFPSAAFSVRIRSVADSLMHIRL